MQLFHQHLQFRQFVTPVPILELRRTLCNPGNESGSFIEIIPEIGFDLCSLSGCRFKFSPSLVQSIEDSVGEVDTHFIPSLVQGVNSRRDISCLMMIIVKKNFAVSLQLHDPVSFIFQVICYGID